MLLQSFAPALLLATSVYARSCHRKSAPNALHSDSHRGGYYSSSEPDVKSSSSSAPTVSKGYGHVDEYSAETNSPSPNAHSGVAKASSTASLFSHKSASHSDNGASHSGIGARTSQRSSFHCDSSTVTKTSVVSPTVRIIFVTTTLPAEEVEDVSTTVSTTTTIPGIITLSDTTTQFSTEHATFTVTTTSTTTSTSYTFEPQTCVPLEKREILARRDHPACTAVTTTVTRSASASRATQTITTTSIPLDPHTITITTTFTENDDVIVIETETVTSSITTTDIPSTTTSVETSTTYDPCTQPTPYPFGTRPSGPGVVSNDYGPIDSVEACCLRCGSLFDCVYYAVTSSATCEIYFSNGVSGECVTQNCFRGVINGDVVEEEDGDTFYNGPCGGTFT